MNTEKQQLGVQGSGKIPSLIRPTAAVKSIADLFDTVKNLNPNLAPKDASRPHIHF